MVPTWVWRTALARCLLGLPKQARMQPEGRGEPLVALCLWSHSPTHRGVCGGTLENEPQRGDSRVT